MDHTQKQSEQRTENPISQETLIESVNKTVRGLQTRNADAAERVMELCALVEDVTGRGLGMDFSEKLYGKNHMQEPGAEQSLAKVRYELKQLLANGLDEENRRMADAYANLAEEEEETLVAEEEGDLPVKPLLPKHKEAVGERSDDIFEIDAGDAAYTINGHSLEHAYMYPKGEIMAPLTQRQMDFKMSQIRADKRDRAVKEEEAVLDALRLNPYKENPIEPDTSWLKKVLYHLWDEMKYFTDETEHMMQNLYLVPAVGTDADLYGADCLAVYTDPVTGKHVVVTIDITAQPDGKLDGKADIVVSPNHAFVHHDIKNKALDGLFTDKESQKISAPKAKERRALIGKAIGIILKEKLKKIERGQVVHHFRLPGKGKA